MHSTTSVCLLHGTVLLPCGISGKMTIPSKSILSLLASCSLYHYVALPTTCYIMPPILPCQASNPPSYQTFVWLCYGFYSAPLIVLQVCSMLEHGYVRISQYLLFNKCIYILGKGWKARPFAWCFLPLLPPLRVP